MSRTLFVLSTGDWRGSILGRNAMGRLRSSCALEVFDHVHYVFFRTEKDDTFGPEPWLTVHEISGGTGRRSGPARWMRFARGWARIGALAAAVRPDAVMISHPFLTGAIGAWLRVQLRVPLVLALVSHYELSWKVGGQRPLPGLPRWPTFALQDRVLRSCDLVLTHCDFYRRYAIDRGTPEQKIVVHPAWAEQVFFDTVPDADILRSHGIRDPRPVVYVGRLSPVKYSEDLLKAFLKIREQHPDREMVVVGGAGPLRPWFESELERAGARDAVHILHASAEDVKSFMAVAGVVLGPHAGYTLLEAGLSAAPVVAYDFEWHPELIEDGRSGRLVPYRDWRAMAAAAMDVLEDPVKAAAMGSALEAKVRPYHRQEAVIAAVNDAFRDLLRGWGG